MLVDIDIPHELFHPILAIISGGKRTTKMHETGCLLSHHWSMDLVLGKRIIDDGPEFELNEPGIYSSRTPPPDKDGGTYFGATGVCDGPQQLLEKYGNTSERTNGTSSSPSWRFAKTSSRPRVAGAGINGDRTSASKILSTNICTTSRTSMWCTLTTSMRLNKWA